MPLATRIDTLPVFVVAGRYPTFATPFRYPGDVTFSKTDVSCGFTSTSSFIIIADKEDGVWNDVDNCAPYGGHFGIAGGERKYSTSCVKAVVVDTAVVVGVDLYDGINRCPRNDGQLPSTAETTLG